MIAFVAACNANGIACCTTVASVDPTTKQALYLRSVHTNNSTATAAPGTNTTEAGGSAGSGGVSAGAVAGAIVGALAAVACSAAAFVWLRRRRARRQAAAAAAPPSPKPSPKAGLLGSSGDDEHAAALATLPTKPAGLPPASVALLLQQLEQMEGGRAGYTASDADGYLLSYVTSLVSGGGCAKGEGKGCRSCLE